MGGRYFPLDGPELARFCATAAELILGAKLNKWFPDPFGTSNILRMLGDPDRGRLAGPVLLDLDSGLPWLKDVLSVRVDRQLAEEFLERNGGALPGSRLEARLAYYGRLVRYHFPPVTRMDVRLVRVLPEKGAAVLGAVFDRFDPGEGVFVRHTLTLEQTDSVWKDASLVERRGGEAVQTPGFRDAMRRFTRDESELTMLLMGERTGIRVKEAVRGRIGPLWSPFAPGPEGWTDGTRDACVLHCPLDAASVELEEDADTDPFTGFFKDYLSARSRPLVEETARELGYRVKKERTFACTPAARPNLLKKLGECGKKCRVLTI